VTLIELQAKARRDLTARPIGVLLEWSWLVAEAHGEVVEALEHLKHLEMLQGQFRGSLLSSFPPSEERVVWFEKYIVSDPMLAESRHWLAEAEAKKRACELVLRLLERPRKKAEAPVIPLHPVKPNKETENGRQEADRGDGTGGVDPGLAALWREAEAQGPARRG
jgi:hypothetical protein